MFVSVGGRKRPTQEISFSTFHYPQEGKMVIIITSNPHSIEEVQRGDRWCKSQIEGGRLATRKQISPHYDIDEERFMQNA